MAELQENLRFILQLVIFFDSDKLLLRRNPQKSDELFARQL